MKDAGLEKRGRRLCDQLAAMPDVQHAEPVGDGVRDHVAGDDRLAGAGRSDQQDPAQPVPDPGFYVGDGLRLVRPQRERGCVRGNSGYTALVVP